MTVSTEESRDVGIEEIVFAAALNRKLCLPGEHPRSELDLLKKTLLFLSEAGVILVFLAASALLDGRPSETRTNDPMVVDLLRTLADRMRGAISESRLKGKLKIVLEPPTFH